MKKIKPIKYVYLVLIGATLTTMGLEKDNPCVDNDIVPLIQNFEGWEDGVYKDLVNIDTIGYGFTRIFINMWDVVFEEIDRDTGNSIVQQYCYAVNEKYFDKTHLTKSQRKAVFSFVYNVGESTYVKSTLNKNAVIRSLSDTEVCNELKKYVYAGGKIVKGLQNRRQNECNIMRN